MGQQWSMCRKSDDIDSPISNHYQNLRPLIEQDYESLKRQCLQTGRLFEDPLFPASSKSLYFHNRIMKPAIPKQWMRPQEIAALLGAEPHFFVKGGAPSDLIQGDLGDCWVVAAASSLADHPHLLARVAPSDQSFSAGYAGIFRFNFFVHGRWLQLVVDDRLPTIQGRMTYVQSSQANEFWGALLEKAYAKLHGCYEALHGGTCAQALSAFTGAAVETYPLKALAPPLIDRVLVQALDSGSLICTGIWGSKNEEMDNGLVTSHAFSVIDAEMVRLHQSQTVVVLLKIRNPWGNRVEWRGRWSDRSNTWSLVSQQTSAVLAHSVREDGVFWMDLEDFVRNFDQVDICHFT